ncbi:vitamin K epoxide reductase family protein [Streptomyces spectabilis]|uniref:Vitamin K epoxide reductase family protein n=2 Tax=Streptomyces spectabilis TaxID=68270 RepID=A0A5P2XJ80_STRST|nr:vitamin K epoxide reductase family protein [Streptomyces spectabilis]MCI3901348.1 vitamin K epoxide reductase family protein [Streptomyces spectabilis]QEV64548.1 vitamin K epoxide reductase family protein [Streptomyces spectabilis]
MSVKQSVKDGAASGEDRADVSRSVGGSRAFALLLVVTGVAGLWAAWIITLDKFELLKDPNFQPGCSINPVVACGSIMKSEQAEAFGFPNPMLGLAAYAVVIGVGMSLLAGARFPRWYWLTFNAGTLFGVGFCTWLQFQSLYRINALCLWCCLAWVATILMFWYVTSFNIRNGFLPAPRWTKTFFEDFTWALPVMHVGVIAVLIFTRWGADLWA